MSIVMSHRIGRHCVVWYREPRPTHFGLDSLRGPGTLLVCLTSFPIFGLGVSSAGCSACAVCIRAVFTALLVVAAMANGSVAGWCGSSPSHLTTVLVLREYSLIIIHQSPPANLKPGTRIHSNTMNQGSPKLPQ
ncbi:hypothetical protein DFP73DRAFT_523183 [Morchella snyderi]|nr:hypothetical protein DFP73DRAFT_523183 [Morchella snyderi]